VNTDVDIASSPGLRRPPSGTAGAFHLQRWKKGAALTPYLLLAPFMIAFFVMQIMPMAYALWLSLFEERLVGGVRFVGLDNYADVMVDPKFWSGVWNMVVFGIVQVPVMIGLGLLLALILDSAMIRGRGFLRIVFYLPYAVPTVIAALVWGYLYGPNYGPLTQLFTGLGLSAPTFLSTQSMLWSIANIVTWEYAGYHMVILFAALQAVPKDLEEAASLDGAGPVAFAWHVKIPLIKPAIALSVVFSIIGTFQLFNEPLIMKRLAPHVIGDHYTPNVYAFSLAFNSLQYNYAAAVSFVVGLIVAVISFAFIAVSSRSGRAK
jgi:multiple sugar transport system permease protein